MTVIGLTGGIASGKSTAAAWLKDAGAAVIDADRLGHRVYEPGTPGFQGVVNEFGHDIVAADGTINRQLLGGKVFGDPTQMKRLTDIVWPEIRRLAREEVTELKRRDKKTHIVLEAAVLVEANWFDLVDEVWVITVEPEIARQRLMTRNGLTEAQAQARIDSQISNKERSLLAYVKIDNSGTLDEFREKVDREWKKLLRRSEPAGAQPIAKPATKTPAKATASRPTASKATSSRATAAPRVAATSKVAATKTVSRANGVKATPVKASAKAAAPKAAAPRATASRTAAKPAAKPAARPSSKVTSTRTVMKAPPRPPARTAATVRRGSR